MESVSAEIVVACKTGVSIEGAEGIEIILSKNTSVHKIGNKFVSVILAGIRAFAAAHPELFIAGIQMRVHCVSRRKIIYWCGSAGRTYWHASVNTNGRASSWLVMQLASPNMGKVKSSEIEYTADYERTVWTEGPELPSEPFRKMMWEVVMGPASPCGESFHCVSEHITYKHTREMSARGLSWSWEEFEVTARGSHHGAVRVVTELSGLTKAQRSRVEGAKIREEAKRLRVIAKILMRLVVKESRIPIEIIRMILLHAYGKRVFGGAVSPSEISYKQVAEGEVAEGEVAEGEVAEGEVAEGEVAEGEVAE